jgi:hypothetical protein
VITTRNRTISQGMPPGVPGGLGRPDVRAGPHGGCRDRQRAPPDQLRTAIPELRAEVKNIVAEGDFVMAHVHGVRVPGQPGTAIVDILRLEDGRIVEHWDVMQPIPDESANPNGMF